MVRFADAREREKEILGLIVESYIKESRPISSAYLCERCRLSCSSATVRNVMVSLERQGFLSHIYTSSGRVPTKKAFKRYVESFREEDIAKEYVVELDFYSLPTLSIDGVINYTLDNLTQLSGYTSMIAVSGRDEKVFFKGMRCILDQPEFGDIRRLKDIFYTLEVKMSAIHDLLFDYIDEKLKILIGDDIGFEEISDCSLVISGLKEKKLNFALALLGPMRMNYVKAAACLHSVSRQLKEVVERSM